MRFGFHTLHFSPMLGGPGAVLDVVAATGEVGFDTIGIDRASLGRLPIGELAGALRAARLDCSDVVPLTVDDAAATVEQATAWAPLAAGLGAPWCVTSVLAPLPFAELAARLRAAADVLEPAGTRLALEFMPHSHLRRLVDARRLRDAIGSDRCAIVLDSFHCLQSATPTAEVAAMDGAEIALVQYSDAAELHPTDLGDHSRNRRRFPGDGVLPLRSWVDAVVATGFDGPVVAEVLAAEVRAHDVRRVAGRCLEVLHRDWCSG